MNRRLEQTQAAYPWIFFLVVCFWAAVLLCVSGKAALPYIIGSGILGLSTWLLLYFADREAAHLRHELEISETRRREEEAKTARSNARIRELEAEVSQTRVLADHWNRQQAVLEQSR